jgi:hypothetical protein
MQIIEKNVWLGKIKYGVLVYHKTVMFSRYSKKIIEIVTECAFLRFLEIGNIIFK